MRRGFFKKILVGLFEAVVSFGLMVFYCCSFLLFLLLKKQGFKRPVRERFVLAENVFVLDTFRLIAVTKKRFITLVAIVFVGSAFMMGLLSTSAIMRRSVDAYGDEMHLQDVQIYSNYGFSDDDLAAVGDLECVERVFGSRFIDCLAISENNNKRVVRVRELNGDVNQFKLVAGRYPQGANECLALYSYYQKVLPEDGYALHLVKDEEGELAEELLNVDYQVVGLVISPEYMSEFDTYSTFHNLTLSDTLYVDKANFLGEYYTSVYLNIAGAAQYDSFSSKYDDYIAEAVDELEYLAESQKDVNKDKILSEAKEKIKEAEEELARGKKEAEAEFGQAAKQLNDANVQIMAGQAAIEVSLQTIEETQKELAATSQELAAGQAQLDEQIAKLEAESGQSFDELYENITVLYVAYQALDNLPANEFSAEDAIEMSQTIAENEDQLQRLEEEEAQITDDMKDLLRQMDAVAEDESLSAEEKTLRKENIEAEYANKKSQLAVVKEEKYDLQVEIDSQKIELEILISDPQNREEEIDLFRAYLDELAGGSVEDAYRGMQEIKAYQQKIEFGYETIATTQAKMDASLAQIGEKEAELAAGSETYYASKKEYDEAYNEYLLEIEDGEAEIAKAYQELSDLAEGKWTILDRTMHYSSALYKSNSQQMHNIGVAFPLLFFLVAALVCMTTMTRLIDEQRNQLGCLLALGYSKRKIIGKYVTYAGLASFCGALPGVFFGVVSFPVVIYLCWGLMYRNPDIVLFMPLGALLVSFLSFIVLICVVTYGVVRSSLKENPSSLMRPKAPKTMRKTFIEKMTFIWQRLSFTSKITIRNIIRYKQRFFMTVIGVAGCCGLLIIGFGVSDSISTIINEQYGGIMRLTHQLSLNDSQYEDELLAYVKDQYAAKDVASFLTYTTSVRFNKQEATAKAVIGKEADLQTYLNLCDSESAKPLAFSADGVIVTEKFAKNNGLSVGDMMEMEAENGLRALVKVEAIAEMYYDHFIFMRDDLYHELFKLTPKTNMITFVTEADSKLVNEELMKQEGVDTVTDISQLTSSFNTMIQSLDLITLVIILAAGFLALVVLINLTEVNISERKREIATLKVLGFRPGEVRSYIFKELIILTLIGSLLGIPFGRYGLGFIMNVLNIDLICFPIRVAFSSYLISIAITYAFLFVILLLERKSLRKIQMVESLKSVE